MSFPKNTLNLPRERDVLHACLLLLRVRKIPHFRLNVAGFYAGEERLRYVRSAPAGVSDILGWLPQWSKHPGRFLALEIKSPSGRTTEEQDAFLELVEFHGGVAEIIRDVKDLEKLLTDLGA